MNDCISSRAVSYIIYRDHSENILKICLNLSDTFGNKTEISSVIFPSLAKMYCQSITVLIGDVSFFLEIRYIIHQRKELQTCSYLQ